LEQIFINKSFHECFVKTNFLKKFFCKYFFVAFNAFLQNKAVPGDTDNDSHLKCYQIICGVDGGATLDSHVEHLHVVEHHQDVGHGVAVGVLKILKSNRLRWIL